MWTIWIKALCAAVALSTPKLLAPVPTMQPDEKTPAVVSRTEKEGYEVTFAPQSGPLLVFDRAVLLSSGPAAVTILEKPAASILPRSGRLALHVGSRPIDLVLAGHRFRVKGMQLRAALAEGVWLVTIDKLFEGAEFSPATPQPSQPSTPSTSPQPVLGQGMSFWIENQGLVLEEEMSIVETVFENTRFGSFTPRREHTVSAVDIESRRFLARPSVHSSGEMPEIELEPVEVEAGCVEICVE